MLWVVHFIMSKPISKEELKQPDSFVLFFDQLFTKIQKNIKILWVSLIIIAIATTAFVVYQQKQKHMNELAANAYAATMEKISTENIFTKEGWESFITDATAFLNTYPSASMAPQMQLAKAKALIHVEKYAEAQALFDQAKEKLPHPYQLLAFEGKAVALAFEEKYNESLWVWKLLTDTEDNPFLDFHMWNLGLTYEKLGQKEEALGVYQRLVDDLKDSPYVISASKRVQILQSQGS